MAAPGGSPPAEYRSVWPDAESDPWICTDAAVPAVAVWLPGLVTVTVLPVVVVVLRPMNPIPPASMPSPSMGSTWPAPATLIPSTGGVVPLPPYVVSVHPDCGVLVVVGVELTPSTLVHCRISWPKLL